MGNQIFSKANALFASRDYLSAAKSYTEAITKYPELAKHLEFMRDFSLYKSRSLAALKSAKSEGERLEFLKGAQIGCDFLRPRFEVDTDSLTPAELDKIYTERPIAVEGALVHDELVSIIIPSYNNAYWIKRAIHSALSQYGVRVEVIVVDDGSTDDSVRIANAISSTVTNIRVISLLKNFGCYYARNIGVLNSNGQYVTIIDSDDIVPPGRILKQLNAIKSQSGAIASIGQLRRWTADFSSPLNELKHGENSLLWNKNIIARIGYYDSVRFGGDSEFRLRVQRTFGLDAFVKIPDEIYYLRTIENSLTASGGANQAYIYEDGKLRASLSKARSSYTDSFNSWQKKNKPKSVADPCAMRLDFPLFQRPFDTGSHRQSASPSINQKRIGGLASFPPREAALKECVKSILPQLDELYVYLNNYVQIPEFLNHPKIHVTLSRNAKGDLRDNGKFYALDTVKDSYIFTLDDDLIYPDDYVARMIHQIELFSRNAVVGVHGVIFPADDFSRLQQRTVFHFNRATTGIFVDLLGTGTTAWHSSTLLIAVADFQTQGVCDLWFARAAALQEVPLYSVPRTQNWVREFKRFDDSLYQEALSQPQCYFDVYRGFVAPALRAGYTRRRMEAHLVSGFDVAILQAAEIQLSTVTSMKGVEVPGYRRAEFYFPAATTNAAVGCRFGQIVFHIVVNGWNCVDYVDDCLRSIATQKLGDYSYFVTLIDDGSTDGTYEKLVGSTLLPKAQLIRIDANSGPAYARHIGISSITNPEAIVVLIDMDDSLEHDALYTVAQRYLSNTSCLMTIGNWRDQNGVCNPQFSYEEEDLDSQRVRLVETFNATHLRTFRRQLYNVITEDDFKFSDGRWLETCTDVALMFPLLDQCYADEVEFISKPIYRYTKMHSSGTLARFGKQHKLDRLEWLRTQHPKPRFRPRGKDL